MTLPLKVFVGKTTAKSAEVNENFTDLLVLNVYNEDFTALTNGSTVTFTTAAKFVLGSIRVYVSGSRQREGGAADYIENNDGSGNGISYTLASAPATSTPLLADYQRANV